MLLCNRNYCIIQKQYDMRDVLEFWIQLQSHYGIQYFIYIYSKDIDE
jgi:hypothetical protein